MPTSGKKFLIRTGPHLKAEQYLPPLGNRKHHMMNQYLLSLDIKTLEALYIEQTDVLKQRLIGGTSLEAVLKQRNKLTAIALAIHKKQGLPMDGVVFGESNSEPIC